MLEVVRYVRLRAEQSSHVCWQAAAVFGLRPVGQKLPFAIVDQAGIAAEPETVRSHLQLDGEVQFALQPGLDDPLPAIAPAIGAAPVRSPAPIAG